MRLFVFDMDNTLIPRGEYDIHPAVIESLNRLLRQGDAVCFASGRPFCSLIHHLNRLESGKKFAVTANGAALVDQNEKVLSSATLDPSIFFELASLFHDEHTTVYGYDDNSGLIVFREDEWTDLETRLNGIPRSRFHFIEKEDKSLPVPMLKAMIATDPERSKNLVIPARFYEKCSISRSDPSFLEILPKGVDKGNRVEMLRRYLSLNKDEVFVFGDGDNDVSMLKPFVGVAMGNAMSKEVFAASKYVTLDVKDDGVSYALEHLLNAFQQ